MNTINCVYLPPLRDAEARLCEGRGSRLARLLRNLCKKELTKAEAEEKPHPLESKIIEFNKSVANDEAGPIAGANELIRSRLKEATGEIFGQDTQIAFAETSFSRIVESLRLLFFPQSDTKASAEAFRGLEENSLGYNNLLYLATILAELMQAPAGELEYLKLLLIEEPEAHLHPQLQMRLLEFLESEAKKVGIQVIVTTHSPVLASAVSLDSIIHLSRPHDDTPRAIPLSQCHIEDKSRSFISRWLDATKSVLLFAKAVILVEGIAEAFLLPSIARLIIAEDLESGRHKGKAKSLEDAGVSVINMNGIYFQHFMQLFCNVEDGEAAKLPVRCAGITDNDPPPESKPTPSNPVEGKNPALQLCDTINQSERCRLFTSPLKTLEYDLAMEGEGNNLKLTASVLAELWPSASGSVLPELTAMQNKDWEAQPESERAENSYLLLELIEDGNIGKGFFAQALAQRLEADPSTVLSIPQYIRSAVRWVMEIDDGPD